MRALIIVDMLNDFVDGKLANPKAQGIIEPLQRLHLEGRIARVRRDPAREGNRDVVDLHRTGREAEG